MDEKEEKKKAVYNQVQVEAAVNGWIVTQRGKPKEIYTHWENLVWRLQYELTSKGDL